MSELKQTMQRAREFIAANLAECCRDELDWQKSSILRDGKLREAAAIFGEVDKTHAIPMAQSETARQAMQLACRTQPEATKDDSLRTSLADLAMALWRTHYRNDSPNFELLPDAAGILSQIDNMVSGLVKPEATKPAQGPLLIARIKRYKEAFGCSTAEAKEACEYGRDLNSDQTAFVSPPKKGLGAAILALPLPNTTLTAEVAGYKVPVYGAQHMRDFAMAALASPADALVAGNRVDALEQVHKFLMGEAPLDGYWFGENSMEVQGIYWWRTKLRAAIQAQKDGQ